MLSRSNPKYLRGAAISSISDFGCPRLGNATNIADCVNPKIPQQRIDGLDVRSIAIVNARKQMTNLATAAYCGVPAIFNYALDIYSGASAAYNQALDNYSRATAAYS